MSAYLLRECTMRYEVQAPGLGPTSVEIGRSVRRAKNFGADKNGLFIEREDAERCCRSFIGGIINEVEVPPYYNGEQDHA